MVSARSPASLLSPKPGKLMLVLALLVLLTTPVFYLVVYSPGSVGTFWARRPFLKNHAVLDDLPDANSTLDNAKSSWIRDVAANDTLGFQKILTLSRGTSWRLDGIQAAASYSGLDIKHPPQPPIAQELLAAFQTLGDEPPGEGSARAWMAHLNLLRFVFQSEFDTALIVEDDVDWDVSIREQMKKLSDGVRALLTARHEASLAGRVNHNSPRGVLRQFKKSDEYGADSSQTKPAGSPAPYGRDWDVLWIGNCGENVSPAVESHDPVLIQTWPDKSAIPHEKYTGFAHNAIMNLPQGTRAAIRSEGPICTFAYGVTNSGARKVLELAGSGDGRAYDIKLSKLCETGDLNCISVAPELFHEYKPAPGKDGALSSEIDAGNGQGEVAHDEALATEMGSTENIVHSARCRALFQTTCLGSGEETSEGS